MTSVALACRPQPGGAPPLRLLPEPDPQNFGAIPADSWKLVTQRAKAILGSLAILAQSRSEFWASYEDVIEATGVWTESGKQCAVRTLQRAIAELVAAGVLEANEIGRGFRFLFRIKGRASRKDSVFRPAEPGPPASNLSAAASNLSAAASNLSRPSYIETTTNYTTTAPEPSSSSSLVSTTEDGDRIRALGVRVAALWRMDEDYSSNLVGHWSTALACGLDRIDHAVMLAEGRKSRPEGPGWIYNVLANWRREGEPPRPVAAPPRPAASPPPPAAAVEPYEPPLPEEIDEWFARAADESAAPWQRKIAETCIREAVRNGVLDAAVLEGLGGASPPVEKKPAAGPGTSFPRDRPHDVDSRQDSSLNGCSKQVSFEAPPLRSALSDRVLRACSSFQSDPLKPAPPGGS